MATDEIDIIDRMKDEEEAFPTLLPSQTSRPIVRMASAQVAPTQSVQSAADTSRKKYEALQLYHANRNKGMSPTEAFAQSGLAMFPASRTSAMADQQRSIDQFRNAQVQRWNAPPVARPMSEGGAARLALSQQNAAESKRRFDLGQSKPKAPTLDMVQRGEVSSLNREIANAEKAAQTARDAKDAAGIDVAMKRVARARMELDRYRTTSTPAPASIYEPVPSPTGSIDLGRVTIGNPPMTDRPTIQPPIAPPAVSAPAAKTLTKEMARELLNQAGGDKDKARKLAQDAGYEF